MAGARHTTLRTILQVGLSLFAVILFAASCNAPQMEGDAPPTLIAHAGGIGNHRTYTNSLEALDLSVTRDFTAVEIDFSWTEDDHLVLLHDWLRDIPLLLGQPPERMSLGEFRSARSPFGLTLLTLADFEPWLRENPEILVFTDFKERNVEGLQRLADAYPQHIHRIVPQVYQPNELDAALDLGFEKIVFTLYDSDLDDDQVVEFASLNRLFGVTIPIRRALASDLPARLVKIEVPVFAHPVNDYPTFLELQGRGVAGVYTDWLAPGDPDVRTRLEPWILETKEVEPIDAKVVSFIPSKMAGLQISLVFQNEGESPEPVGVELVDPNGGVLAAAEVVLEPGADKRLNAVDLFPPSVDQGWIRAEASPDIQAASHWVFRDNPEKNRPMLSTTCLEFIARGPGAGVSGLLVALVNPTASAHTYVLRRRIGLDLVDEESVEIKPHHQLIRIYRNRTDEDIELSVVGGPMVPLILRWDPLTSDIE